MDLFTVQAEVTKALRKKGIREQFFAISLFPLGQIPKLWILPAKTSQVLKLKFANIRDLNETFSP